MRFLSPNQLFTLEQLERRRLDILSVNANTAAALLHRGAITYHTEKNNAISYRITKSGRQLIELQTILGRARSFGSFRAEVVAAKRRR